MALALIVSLMLVACRPGNASVLRRSAAEPEDARAPAVIRTNRCPGDPVQNIRKAILDSLNLQMEPRVSVSGMTQIREQWRNVFHGTGDSSNVAQQQAAEDTLPPSSSSSSSSSSSENSTQHLQCCKFASQVFLKDLGWNEWIIYPESFTFVHCTVCVPQPNPRMLNCRDDDPSDPVPSSQKPCCETTSSDPVPLLYLDESGSLVISSVSLSRDCGCNRGDDPQALQP